MGGKDLELGGNVSNSMKNGELGEDGSSVGEELLAGRVLKVEKCVVN